MLFFVTGKSLGALPGKEPVEIAAIMEFALIASGDALVQWEKEGKIKAGGVSAGSRTSSLIFEASSHDEVNTLLRSLPYWGLVDWQITPLVSLDAAVASDRTMLEDFKAHWLA